MNDLLSVKETAQILETDATNVYALVRKGILNNSNHFSDPIKISHAQLKSYLNARLPSKFTAVYVDDSPNLMAA